MPAGDDSGAEGCQPPAGYSSLSPNGAIVDILFDARWDGPQGIARFGREIRARLPSIRSLAGGMRLFHPLEPLWLSYVIARAAPTAYFTPGFNVPTHSTRPFVFTIHDLNYVHCDVNSDALRRAYFNVLVKRACRRAARILTVSDFSRAQILEWARIGPQQVVNVGAGVSPIYTPYGPCYDIGSPYVLYVGNRLAHKNVPRLLRAFRLAEIDCKLVLTGSPDHETVLLARDLGIAERVHFTGYVPEEHMPALYRGARVLALPSLFEGFGLPVIEAMACGTPVLASTTTSLPEIAGNAALLADPLDIESIADGLRRLAHDDALRSTLATRGVAQAAKFSWDSTAAKVAAVLSEV